MTTSERDEPQPNGPPKGSGSPGSVVTPFLAAAMLGFAGFLAAVVIGGAREPWDGSIRAYVVSTVAVGGLCGAFVPRRFWLWGVAIYCGQAIALALDSAAEGNRSLWFPVGLITLLPAGVAAIVGAGFGAVFGIWARGGSIEDL